MGVVFVTVYGAMIVLVLVNIVYLRSRSVTRTEIDVQPLVSVIIPARNEAQNLARLIPSLLNQKYEHFEVVIYNDASEDETADVVVGFKDSRLKVIFGDGPPPGWVGKVHALYQATRVANGEVFLFLDADTQLRHERSLLNLVSRFMAVPQPRVLSGIPRLSGGGGDLLVSMVTFSLLAFFPVPLAPVGRRPSLGVLAGACWMIERDVYLEHEPHRTHPSEVLDDVVSARYLKSRGAAAHMQDLQSEVEAFMYKSHSEAWKGFRKNAYLIAGGPLQFAVTLTGFILLFVVIPLIWWPGIVAVYTLKAIADRFTGFSIKTTLLAPVSFLMTVALNIDSAVANTTGIVRWKGRVVNGPKT